MRLVGTIWGFRMEIVKAGLARQVNQYFTVLTGIRSVGVIGDERTCGCSVSFCAFSCKAYA